MKTTNENCAGYIQLVFFDEATGEAVTIGGAGFLTDAEFDAAWANLPEHIAGPTSFQADRMDSNCDILDDKTVSAQTCELVMGKPITTLIIEGREKLAAEIAQFRNT